MKWARSWSGEMAPYSARCARTSSRVMPWAEPGRPKTTLRARVLLAVVVHGGVALGGEGLDFGRVVLGRALAGEDVDVEGGEVGVVEAHAGAAVGDPPGEVGAGPVEDRHEVVADDLDAGGGEVSRGSRGSWRCARASRPSASSRPRRPAGSRPPPRRCRRRVPSLRRAISAWRRAISSGVQTSPVGTWWSAETTPSTPACSMSSIETRSFGPNQRQVCRIGGLLRCRSRGR